MQFGLLLLQKKKTLINPLQSKHSFSNERIQPLNILTFEFIIPSISCTHWSPCCWTDFWKVLKDTVIPKQSKIEKHIEMKIDSCILAGTNGKISMMSVCWMEPPSEGNDVIVQYCGWGWVGCQRAWGLGTVVFSTSCMLSWERCRYHHHARSKEMEVRICSDLPEVAQYSWDFFFFPKVCFQCSLSDHRQNLARACPGHICEEQWLTGLGNKAADLPMEGKDSCPSLVNHLGDPGIFIWNACQPQHWAYWFKISPLKERFLFGKIAPGVLIYTLPNEDGLP